MTTKITQFYSLLSEITSYLSCTICSSLPSHKFQRKCSLYSARWCEQLKIRQKCDLKVKTIEIELRYNNNNNQAFSHQVGEIELRYFSKSRANCKIEPISQGLERKKTRSNDLLTLITAHLLQSQLIQFQLLQCQLSQND